MNRQFLRVVLLFACVLAGAACQPPTADPPTAATRIAESGAEAWSYVALGSSHSWGWLSHYAAHLEADLGVAVTVYDESQSRQDALGLVAMLANRPAVVERLEQADVVTIVALGGPALGQCVNGRGDYLFGDKPLDETLVAYRANYDAMITAVVDHVDPAATLVRGLDLYNPLVGQWQAEGRFEECQAAFAALTAELHAAYEAHGIPVVAVHAALNGPDGTIDLDELGYLRSDGLHLNDEGGRVVAQLVRDSGYAYTVP